VRCRHDESEIETQRLPSHAWTQFAELRLGRSYDRGALTNRARVRRMPKEGKTPEETAELRLLSAALPKAIDKAAKAMGADTLSNKALLYVLEGTTETEVDTIIQKIRQLSEPPA
jgi:hypothetical protein